MTPQFPNFVPIELAHRPIFIDFFREYQPQTSELNFSNLFMWREYYQFQWCLLDEWLLIKTSGRKAGESFFPPIGPSARQDLLCRILPWLRDEKQVETPMIQRADPRLVKELSSHLFDIQETPDHFDYVYTRESLSTLAGRKLHAKRNHINKFNRLYEYEYRSITKSLVVDCLLFYRKWCDQRNCDENDDLRYECRAIHQTLLNWDDLDLKGGALLVDGEVVAFTVGEPMNDNTAVVHIEKAAPDIPQLYAVINQQFCQHTWPQMEFINREQDLGKPGLRQAKSSYNPHYMVEKYVITLK